MKAESKLYLIMCEGEDEKAFLDVLIEKDLFIYSEDQLLNGRIYHARNLKAKTMKPELSIPLNTLDKSKVIHVIRVMDKNNDALKIPSEYRDKISPEITDVLTTPELEILCIINEGLISDFYKVKSKLKPSEFYKIHSKHYSKSRAWFNDYFFQLSNEQIRSLLQTYDQERKRAHPSNLSISCFLKKGVLD